MDGLTIAILLVAAALLIWYFFFSESLVVITTAGTYDLVAGNQYRIDATTGSVVLTLPLAKGSAKQIRVHKAAAGATVTYALSGSDSFDSVTNSGNPPTYATVNTIESLLFVSDGLATWYCPNF